MSNRCFLLLFVALLTACSQRTTTSTGPSVRVLNVLQLGLHVNSHGELVLDGQVSVPLTPAEQVVGVGWDFAFQTILDQAATTSNSLVILWEDADGSIVSTTYAIREPFQVNFEHDQWVRRIEHVGDGNIVVAVERAAIPVNPPNADEVPPAPDAQTDPGPSRRLTSPTDPEAFIRYYFGLIIEDDNYQAGWSLLTSAFKEKNAPGGYAYYVDIWSQIESVDITSISVYEHTASSAKCRVNATFYSAGGTDRQELRYHLIRDSASKTWLFESP